MRIKWSPKRKCLDLLSNSLNTFFKEMYGDQFGEYLFLYMTSNKANPTSCKTFWEPSQLSLVAERCIPDNNNLGSVPLNNTLPASLHNSVKFLSRTSVEVRLTTWSMMWESLPISSSGIRIVLGFFCKWNTNFVWVCSERPIFHHHHLHHI